MIVRNEEARIKRAILSAIHEIDSAVIVDTGSTDKTIRIAREVLGIIPHRFYNSPFINFSQARNHALHCIPCAFPNMPDYALLMDADMELVVEDSDWSKNLDGPSYQIEQRAGGLSYWNTRLIRCEAIHMKAEIYKGVTHEYIDLPTAGQLRGVWFRDYADGANRPNKAQRDIDLILAALRDEPDNARYHFYLGQSYRDQGKWEEAAAAYKRRVELGGWDQEVWNAQVNYAHCLNNMGNEAGFIREMLEAHNMRPSRAEAFYDLAKHFRGKGKNNLGVLFSKAGMGIPYPDDVLFIDDHCYKTGLREEHSICAYYTPERQEGFRSCNWLTLDKNVPTHSKNTAKNNLIHYLKPLSHWVPSFAASEIVLPPKEGYKYMNPSVVTMDGRLFVNVRKVNYEINHEGQYIVHGLDGSIIEGKPIDEMHPIVTENIFAALDYDDLSVIKHHTAPLEQIAEAPYKLVQGYEDIRLFVWDGFLYGSACVRERNPGGMCEQYLVPMEGGPARLVPGPDKGRHEKNWMPFIEGDQLRFMYDLCTVVDYEGNVKSRMQHSLFDLSHLRGGSQLIPFYDGWLALVHEAWINDNKRCYWHRFVWFDMCMNPVYVGLPFVFHDKVIEFAAGMCWHPDGKRIVISYGREDKAAWIATVDALELKHFAMRSVLPSP
jgi:glycosyltransferase involved in cell wall biosynthesis